MLEFELGFTVPDSLLIHETLHACEKIGKKIAKLTTLKESKNMSMFK